MRFTTKIVVIVGICVFVHGSLICAQSEKPNETPTRSASPAATEEEVAQLRREVAELKAIVQQLVQASGKAAPAGVNPAHTNSIADASQTAATASPAEATTANISTLQTQIDAPQKQASNIIPVATGWNGEHFNLTSSDGNFTIMPVGYLNAQYTFYKGDGAPPDTFSIQRARFGVQGTF